MHRVERNRWGCAISQVVCRSTVVWAGREDRSAAQRLHSQGARFRRAFCVINRVSSRQLPLLPQLLDCRAAARCHQPVWVRSLASACPGVGEVVAANATRHRRLRHRSLPPSQAAGGPARLMLHDQARAACSTAWAGLFASRCCRSSGGHGGCGAGLAAMLCLPCRQRGGVHQPHVIGQLDAGQGGQPRHQRGNVPADAESGGPGGRQHSSTALAAACALRLHSLSRGARAALPHHEARTTVHGCTARRPASGHPDLCSSDSMACA